MRAFALCAYMTHFEALPPATSVISVAVDCMGGDLGIASTLPACRAFLAKHKAARLVLVGNEQAQAALGLVFNPGPGSSLAWWNQCLAQPRPG